MALDNAEKTLNYACYAQLLFENGDDETKRAILSALGSNLYISDQKLIVDLHIPLQMIEGSLADDFPNFDTLEPTKNVETVEDFFSLMGDFVQWCG